MRMSSVVLMAGCQDPSEASGKGKNCGNLRLFSDGKSPDPNGQEGC